MGLAAVDLSDGVGTQARLDDPGAPRVRQLFGRSLGAVALALAIMGYVAASNPWQYRFMFDLVILIGILLTGVHVYGFLTKAQPLIEHLEIMLYAVGSVVAWYVYPQPPG